MTILQASPDRLSIDGETDASSPPASASASASASGGQATPGLRKFRASTLEEAVAAAAHEMGQALTVVEANRIRRGGLGGFFATDLGVEVVVAPIERTDGESGTGATEAVDRLLERFSDRDGDRFSPSRASSQAAQQTTSPRPTTPAVTDVTVPSTTSNDETPAPPTARRKPLMMPLPTDDEGPVFDLSDDDRPEDGPIFDLSDDDDAPTAEFDFDFEESAREQPVESIESPVESRLEDALADGVLADGVVADGVVAADRVEHDDDLFEPIEPEWHPFADRLEEEMRAMTEAAAPVSTVEAPAITEPAPAGRTRPIIEPELVDPPRNSPPPILDVLTDQAAEREATAWLERVLAERNAGDAAPEATSQAATEEVALDAATVDDQADGGSAVEPGAAAGVAVPATSDDSTTCDSLAEIDQLLRDAGIDPLASIEAAPTLVQRPTSLPSTDIVFDAADRLAEQIRAVDADSGRRDGLRRMQVKIIGADGTRVEMNAEWDDRG